MAPNSPDRLDNSIWSEILPLVKHLSDVALRLYAITVELSEGPLGKENPKVAEITLQHSTNVADAVLRLEGAVLEEFARSSTDGPSLR